MQPLTLCSEDQVTKIIRKLHCALNPPRRPIQPSSPLMQAPSKQLRLGLNRSVGCSSPKMLAARHELSSPQCLSANRIVLQSANRLGAFTNFHLRHNLVRKASPPYVPQDKSIQVRPPVWRHSPSSLGKTVNTRKLKLKVVIPDKVSESNSYDSFKAIYGL